MKPLIEFIQTTEIGGRRDTNERSREWERRACKKKGLEPGRQSMLVIKPTQAQGVARKIFYAPLPIENTKLVN